MAGLLYREFILNKKNLLMIAGGEVLVSFIMFIPFIFKDGYAETEFITALLSVFAFIMMFLILGMLTANFFEADERSEEHTSELQSLA